MCRTFMFFAASFFAASLRADEPAVHDVLIYGGTSGGVTAAVQTARLGKKVVLIEPGKHLGGLTSGGLGATDIGNKKAIGGLSRDFLSPHSQALRRRRFLEGRDVRRICGPEERQVRSEGRHDVDLRAPRGRADLSRDA